MITAENITLHELIGLDTEITQSSNVQLVGFKGKVVDETKSMFVLNTDKGMKKIPKENTIWQFSLRSNKIILDGNMLSKRSFERLGGKT